MNRRGFLASALSMIATTGAQAQSPAPKDGLSGYADQLSASLQRSGGGRFLGDEERALFAAHTRIRAEYGLPELELHDGLAVAARAHAADQGVRNFFGHVSPEGFELGDRVGLLARTFLGLPGENVIDSSGRYFPADPEGLMSSWMDSPGHRENILHEDYTHLGLGVVQRGARTIAVAVFGQRFSELEAPIPLASDAADIAFALQGAQPPIHGFDLSPVGQDQQLVEFEQRATSGLPAGAYTLRPRLRSGRDFTIVYGPIVELKG